MYGKAETLTELNSRTVCAAEPRTQVRPDEESGQVGRQVEVALGVRVFGEGEVLH